MFKHTILCLGREVGYHNFLYLHTPSNSRVQRIPQGAPKLVTIKGCIRSDDSSLPDAAEENQSSRYGQVCAMFCVHAYIRALARRLV